jgi:hypothetical protein
MAGNTGYPEADGGNHKKQMLQRCKRWAERKKIFAVCKGHWRNNPFLTKHTVLPLAGNSASVTVKSACRICWKSSATPYTASD